MSNRKKARGEASQRSGPPRLWPLLALNFFMADFQAGIGPFLGVFLQSHGWLDGWIGTVMTAGGIAGMLVIAPAGALVDATPYKRACIIILGSCTILGSALVLLSQNFWVVTVSQVATAASGTAVGPAIFGLTLGLVKQAGFNRQLGRNQAANHAGNVVGAALSGLLGYAYGLPAVFWLAVLFGVLTIISVLAIPAKAINHRAARGAKEEGEGAGEIGGLDVLFRHKPLLILAAALGCFHLGNAAMLPFYGLAMVARGSGDPASSVATTIVVAQAVMIVASLAAMGMVEKHGYWPVLLVSFLVLPLRGVIAACVSAYWGVYPVQILDGIGAGLQSVAVPGLVAKLLDGSGRVNVGQGSVMTLQALGASVSPLLAGWVAQLFGYGPMFLVLGGFALVSTALWIGFAPMLKPACRRAEAASGA